MLLTRERELFEASLTLDPSARADYLARECESDQERERVHALLAAHLKAAQASIFVSGVPGLPTEERIGPYRLLEHIGRGGIGEVYLAEQERPVRRRVALKMLRADMECREVVARFELERQTLALMDHPNFARILDAGVTAEGQPYV